MLVPAPSESPPASDWSRTPAALRAGVRAARRSAVLRYTVGLGAVEIAVALAGALRSYIANDVFVFFYGAVFVAGWFGGLGPGLAATLFAAFTANFFFVQPYESVGPYTHDDGIRVVVFSFIAVGASYLTWSQGRAVERARHLVDESAALAEQLQEQASELEVQVEASQALSEELANKNQALAATADEARAARDETQRLIDTANEGVWTLDPDGRTTYVNRRMADMLGYTPSEMIGRAVSDFFVDDEARAQLRDNLARRAVGEAGETDYRMVRRDGQPVWLHVSSTPVRDGAGAVTGVLGMFTDVTERVRAERRVAFLADASASLAASLDYAVTLDAVARLTIEELADLCIVDVVEPRTGELARVATRGRDAGRVAIVEAIQRRFPLPADAPHGPPFVVRTGRVQVATEVSAALLDETIADPEHRALARELDVYSACSVPLSVGGRTIGALTLVRHGPGRQPGYTDDDAALAVELARRAAVAIDNARLLRASEEAEGRAEFLAAATATLSVPLLHDERMAQLAEMAVPALADYCVVDAVDDAGVMRRLAVAHVDPALEPALRASGAYAANPGPDSPLAEAMRTGEPRLVARLPDGWLERAAQTPEHLALLRRLHPHSVMLVPLAARGRALGLLSLARAERPDRPFTPADLDFAGELARRAALAVDNARLYEAEAHAREVAERAVVRAERLQAVTAALATALTPQEVADAVVGRVIPALGARAGALGVITGDGQAIEIVATTGYDAESVARFRRVPLDADFPLADAVRGGAPIVLADGAARAARYPHLDALRQANGGGAMVAAPLLAGGRTVGVLGFNFPEGTSLAADGADHDFLTALAGQCAQAVERARLYEAERAARDAADRGTARADFLSEASAVLASSLEEDAALDAVAALAVPRLADWCAVDVADDDGTVRRVALANPDPALVAVARHLERLGPMHPDAPTGPAHAIRSGRTEVIRDLEAAYAAPGGHANPQLRLGHDLGVRSYVCTPMIARGRTLGAVTLATADSGRLFEEADVSLATELARRAAVAVDNARLFHAAQAANRAKSAFLATMSHELRTPLNAIGGYADLMELGVRGPITDAQRVDLVRIKRSQRHLLAVIEDVLSFAKIEAARVRYEIARHPLHALVGDLEVLVAPQLQAKEMRFVYEPCDDGLAAMADADRTQQVVLNLLSNALKYTPPGGQIWLRCAEAGDRVLVQVQDTGVGIDADQLEMIFEPFTQVSGGLTRSVEGTGLGLAISRELARGMGGDLTVESRVGEGSTFTLALPRAGMRDAGDE